MLIKEENKIDKYIPAFLLKDSSTLWIFLLASLGVAIQLTVRGPAAYNNYIIFESSFSHLINDQNLYRNYWDEYNDLYLYSPTFALLIAPLTLMPLWIQVIIWCCLNGFCVYYALRLLPLNNRQRLGMCLFMLIEYINASQNVQVAPMVAAFIIFAFAFFERDKIFLAAFFIVLATFIKVYAIVAAILFLFYPNKLRFTLYMIFWATIFLLAPLLVNTPHQVMFQYHQWINLTLSIHQGEETGVNPNIAIPLSVMGWLKTWFNLNPPSLYVQIAGTILLCLPFLRKKYYKDTDFKLLVLASILIWAMIFNHIAESASYIVAILGATVWLVTDKRDLLTIALAVLVFVLSVLSPTSLFPHYIKIHYVVPYALKAFPCILLWFVIIYELLFTEFGSSVIVKS